MLLPLPVQNSITETGMARQLRKKSGTGIYHVMLRGINRTDPLICPLISKSCVSSHCLNVA